METQSENGPKVITERPQYQVSSRPVRPIPPVFFQIIKDFQERIRADFAGCELSVYTRVFVDGTAWVSFCLYEGGKPIARAKFAGPVLEAGLRYHKVAERLTASIARRAEMPG